MSERWTPIYDRMFDPDHQLAGDEACRRWAWADLCHMAQYEDGVRIIKGQVVPLKRGELVASIRFLADRWRWSRGKVSRFMELLQNPHIAKIETVRETPGGTVYRVVSYDTYANPGDSRRDTNGAADGTETGQRRDTNGTKNSSNSSTSSEQQVPEEPTPSDDPQRWMHDLWHEELGIDGHPIKLTRKRRQKYRAMYTEQLASTPDPRIAWRAVLKAVQRSDHHMSKRDYQMPESLLNDAERREKWVQRTIDELEDGATEADRQYERTRRETMRAIRGGNAA